MSLLYDPPNGWRYGFPKPYRPLTPGEPVAQTLIRDGYPEKDAEFGAKHCRYLGSHEEIEKLVESDGKEEEDASRS